MKIAIELTPEQAAGLKRFAEKVSHDQARSVLYPHVKAETRAEQTGQILSAFSELEEALGNAGSKSWPWIEVGAA